MMTSYEFVSAWLQARCKTDRGASLVEYALLLGLIAVVLVGTITALQGAIAGRMGAATSAMLVRDDLRETG